MRATFCKQIKLLYSRNFSSYSPQAIRNPELPTTKAFINNEWVSNTTGETFAVINPTTGKKITDVEATDKVTLDKAVEAARHAFSAKGPWRQMDITKRGRLLNKLADLIERDAVLMASLETLECGKLFEPTLTIDLQKACVTFRYCAGWVDKIPDHMTRVDGNYLSMVQHEPVGVAGLICAWNFSMIMAATKVASALAAGCTVVLKPSQHSTLAVLHLGKLVQEAGLPPGIVNIVPGNYKVGELLSEHPDVDVISATCSTEVGKKIYRKGADTIKRHILELGGKSPVIVLEDADIEKAAILASKAALSNMGQCCCAGSRTYVHESIYEKFVKKSKEIIQNKVIGDPFDPKVNHGPQATEEQLKIVTQMIETGKKEGAKLEIGGKLINSEGYFIEPALFTDVNQDMTIAKEEIFGPVQQITPFKTLDEVIEMANNSKYALAAGVISNDINKVNTLIQYLTTGNVWVNCYYAVFVQTPFGGHKLSGVGTEGSIYSILAFCNQKSVSIKVPQKIN